MLRSRPTGRPTRLTAELQKKICSLLSKCVTVRDACAAVGIHYTTFYNWRARGEAEASRLTSAPEGTQPVESEQIYLNFFYAVTRAEAQAREYAAKTIHEAMRPTRIVERTVETFTETRLNRRGEPYEYVRRREMETVRQQPGDWRAAVEYLKRRDKDHWTDRLELEGRLDHDVNLRVDPEQYERALTTLAHALGVGLFETRD